ncbi:hypothetical protein OC834_007107 [Tilletia horrida]|nr:hypothetical protein OC834_007107 [Tilletia horrida]
MQETARLSSTSLNVVGLAGDAGVYLSVGRWVDKSGPRHLVVLSSHHLAFFNFLTGLGNSTAFAAAMCEQGKSWNEIRRNNVSALRLQTVRLFDRSNGGGVGADQAGYLVKYDVRRAGKQRAYDDGLANSDVLTNLLLQRWGVWRRR